MTRFERKQAELEKLYEYKRAATVRNDLWSLEKNDGEDRRFGKRNHRNAERGTRHSIHRTSRQGQMRKGQHLQSAVKNIVDGGCHQRGVRSGKRAVGATWHRIVQLREQNQGTVSAFSRNSLCYVEWQQQGVGGLHREQRQIRGDVYETRRRLSQKENETLRNMAINEKRLYIRIAGLAMQGLISKVDKNYQTVMQLAFNYADAFMKEYKNRTRDGENVFDE